MGSLLLPLGPDVHTTLRVLSKSGVSVWMDLETVIQSEVSQEEKNKYRILMHICGT